MGRDATACYRRMNLFLKHLDGMKEDIKIGDPSQDPSKNLTAEQKAEVQMLLLAMFNNADGLRADLGWCDSSSKEVQSFQKRLAALDKKASGREQGMAQRMFAPSAAAAVVSEMELDMAAPGEQTEGQADAHI